MSTEDLIDGQEFMKLHGGPWRRQGDWMMGYCQAHADGTKHGGKGGESLGVSVTKGVIQCWAGCDVKAIMAAARERAGVAREDRPADSNVVQLRRMPDKLVKVYVYRDAFGEPVGEKARWESVDGSKRFTWRKPGMTEWPSGSSDLRMADMPLYGTELLAERAGEPVYFCEGEKATDACIEQGLLAVTGAGGASQKDFGQALQVLKGRTIHLWADNDAPGASYMAYIKSQLQTLACTVFVVQVPLGPKQDAWDYFHQGGTLQGLESVDPSKPLVVVEGEDAVRVVMASPAGAVTFNFTNLEKTRREFKTELSVTAFNQPDPYVEQLNLNSNSGTTALRRDLDTVFGKEFDWVRVLNKAFGLVREAFLNQENGTDVINLPVSSGEILLVNPLVVANGVTIFFGDGASLKSYLIATLALCCAMGIPFLGSETPNLTPLYVDWEDDGANFHRRLDRVATGLGCSPAAGVHYWDARGLPLCDQVDALQRYITNHGIGLLILDSAAPACGGDPLDHSAVVDLFRALKRIGLPTIIIAHVTKAMEATKPFGSAYWHNLARRTWYVARASEEDSDEVDVALFNRKVNDGRIPPPQAYHVTFSPDDYGPVHIERGDLNQAGEGLQQHRSAKDQIWHALGGKPRTVLELAEETGLSSGVVDKVVRRGPFVPAGFQQSARKGGRPSALWARQEGFRQTGGMAETGGDNPKMLYD